MPEFCKRATDEQNIGKIKKKEKNKQSGSEGIPLPLISSLILCSIVH